MLDLILFLFVGGFLFSAVCGLWDAWNNARDSSIDLVPDQEQSSPEERAAAARRYRRIKRGQ